jgi:hypothetical protein
VESSPGEGALFTVELPGASAGTGAAAHEQTKGAAALHALG